ncbi:MAG: hypothetical protein ISR89_09225 [Candidatus Marinimicrobia bacterium]|nr:hypothetical protein [Candidatus Neomarinimicrobiota bacterium]MBL7031335.1 hypothetical protein [Candidatus Neomarinimicrobiota bacterium]
MKNLLMASYWIGIVADAISALLLFSPRFAEIILNPRPFEISDAYLYVSRIGGTLVAGWTVLLFWAQKKPVERVDILLITVFPVITLLTVFAVLAVNSNHISFQRMLSIFILYLIIIPTYITSYLWAKKQQ